jgi:SAM-dependent methyltransferase
MKLKEAKGMYPAGMPFDELAADYDAWFEEEGKLIFNIEVRALEEILPSLPRPWLEIGVGSGRFAQSLEIDSGIDPSIGLIEMAQRRGITVFLAMGEQEPFRDGSFGTVFLIVTICFVESPLSVLKEAHRILVPDGKAVLGLVLGESPWGKFYEGKKQEGHRFYKYATFYKYSDLVELVERAGFRIEEVISTLFQKPGEVEYLETPRSGYQAGAGFTVLVLERS